jgi:cell pole-organizing protein PopZ
MGKPETTPPTGQSIDQLLSSIRQAIEADGVAVSQPHVVPDIKPLNAPMAPRRPDAADQPNAEPAHLHETHSTPQGDEQQHPGYISGNPFRYRHSLGSSPSYMSLRNRLASLNSRTRADSHRSFASLLGGDVREEEARARGAVPEQAQPQLAPQPQPQFEPQPHPAPQPQPAGEQPAARLRATMTDEEAHVDEFVTAELASGSVSYSPDYHEWSLERSLNDFGDRPQAIQPVAAEPGVVVGEADATPIDVPTPAPVVEPAVINEPEPQEATAEQDTLPLEAMIRQVIEPELAHWFDTHLPEHVARAMPDEQAFIAMIRPLIEDWLRDNLEPIVETTVRDEIARITGLKR